MGAQLAGGIDKQKEWMVDRDRTFVQVPFPDGYKNEDTSFDLFLKTLAGQGVRPRRHRRRDDRELPGGRTGLPAGGVRAASWKRSAASTTSSCATTRCRPASAAPARCSAIEHYGITPDLIACGKGISSSLPISAVIGREDIMDLYAPGSMTSTHSGSPLPVAAAIANLEVICKERLVERAARLGEILMPELRRIQRKYPDVLGCCQGKGLVAGIQVVKPGTKTPDPELAQRINVACFQKGLLMFAPVGVAASASRSPRR